MGVGDKMALTSKPRDSHSWRRKSNRRVRSPFSSMRLASPRSGCMNETSRVTMSEALCASEEMVSKSSQLATGAVTMCCARVEMLSRGARSSAAMPEINCPTAASFSLRNNCSRTVFSSVSRNAIPIWLARCCVRARSSSLNSRWGFQSYTSSTPSTSRSASMGTNMIEPGVRPGRPSGKNGLAVVLGMVSRAWLRNEAAGPSGSEPSGAWAATETELLSAAEPTRSNILVLRL